MNIREAILAAANHIYARPSEFKFESTDIPDHPSCGTPGCAIGWIQTFFGDFVLLPMCGGQSFEGRPYGAMQVSEGEFYDRMNKLSGGSNWINDAYACAAALRLYANLYHPAKPIVYPKWKEMAASQTVPADAVDEMVRA